MLVTLSLFWGKCVIQEVYGGKEAGPMLGVGGGTLLKQAEYLSAQLMGNLFWFRR